MANRRLLLSIGISGGIILVLVGVVGVIATRLVSRSAHEIPFKPIQPVIPAQPVIVTTRPGPLIEGVAGVLRLVPKDVLPSGFNDPPERRKRLDAWLRDNLQGRRAAFRASYGSSHTARGQLLVYGSYKGGAKATDGIRYVSIDAYCPLGLQSEVDKLEQQEAVMITGRISYCDIYYYKSPENPDVPAVPLGFNIHLDDATIVSVEYSN